MAGLSKPLNRDGGILQREPHNERKGREMTLRGAIALLLRFSYDVHGVSIVYGLLPLPK